MTTPALPAASPSMSLSGRRVTVMGLGRFGGGIGVTRFLAGEGAQVLVTDQETPENLAASVERIADLVAAGRVTLRLGEHLAEDFASADLVVASPAVKPGSPFLAAARGAGVPVTGEIRLLAERLPNRKNIIALTGSAGKSTTTALVGHALAQLLKEEGRGRRVWVGGNIGGSLLADLPNIAKDDLVVLELSSFMLEGLREDGFAPGIAVVTNLAPNHLDWHPTLADYAAAKKNVFRFQKPGDKLFLGPGHRAAADRYRHCDYRRVGRSGLQLPPLSLGLWYNFGDNRPFDEQRRILRHAFDRGITHFDLANNYGPPYGAAEENFGRMLRGDLRPYRDELVISSKAGWDMWPGPYGQLGSRKYLVASLDASLRRMGLDYVDIFYSHRFDAHTPLEETIGALDALVRQGKALYVGVSSYSAERTREAAAIARRLGTPLTIHQPSYSLLNRWIEEGLLDTLAHEGMGAIAFTALAQGLLTDRYLQGSSEVQRATARPTFRSSLLTESTLARVRGLNEIARRRGQTLAQMALVWVLRDPRVTSTLIGASSVAQLDENLAALERPDFSPEELREIDGFAVDSGIDLWRVSSDL